MDDAVLRKKMVEVQLSRRGIKDKRVLDAFYKVERHRFIPKEYRSSAYEDSPVPIGSSQTISQPYIVALMTESLELSGEEKVLEIGTGSGYQTAILAELVTEVYSIERINELAEKADKLLVNLGYQNIKIKIADGTLGWPEASPFDRIIITAASNVIPEPLIKQLNENGILIAPLGRSFGQVLTLAKKKVGMLQYQEICGCSFVPLIGKYASN